MEKINLVEILKDCPKGMELDCPIFSGLEFDHIDENNGTYPIICRVKTEFNSYNIHTFTEYGCYSTAKYAKCVIFPKGKTTWEGFVPPCKFKVGDKVTHNMGILMNVVHMYWDAECNVIRYDIQSPVDNNYKLKAMLAEHLQPYKEPMESKPNLLQQLKDYFDNTPRDVLEKEWHEYDKYNEISPTVNEYLEYVNKIRQPKYPKTYVECAKILNCFNAAHIDGYKNELLDKFQELLICRDAYWKIGGEEMGLGKPWEPDWNNISDKYCIYIVGRKIWLKECQTRQCILAFPTAKMRDAFKENFDGDIDVCKELL